MKILGALGIDWKIFLIQSLNFLILFFILKLLFFNSFISALRKEKAKDKETKKLREDIIREKNNWQAEKNKEITEIRMKVNKMLSDAKMFANKIKEENTENFLKEQKKLLEKISQQSKAIADKYEKDMIKNYKEQTFLKLIEIFKTELSIKSKTDIQNNFWFSFIKKIDAIKKDEIIQMLLRYKNKIPPIIIHSSVPLSKNQKNDIEIILKKKLLRTNLLNKKKHLPKKLKIKKDIKNDLIAGFQLELNGILVQENLKEKIKKIIEK